MSRLKLHSLRAGAAIVVVTAMVIAWSQIADAQPGQPPAKPAKPAQPAAKAQPKRGQPRQPKALKGRRGGQPPGARRPGSPKPLTPEKVREMLKARRAGKGRPAGKGAPVPVEAEPKKKKFPRDEHGHCIGQGANDRPKDINLFHGWMGVNNEKAMPEPRRESGWDWGWWKWRLTPYLWRYENHDDHCDPRNQPIPLLANIVNLGVLLFLLVRFGRKPVKEALKKRKSTIMEEVDRAQEIKTAAKKRLAHYESELDHLDDKLVALRVQYKSEGVAEEKRARDEMKTTRQRMMNDAEFRITQEGKTSRDTLSREALDAALSAAEALLEKSVSAADHERLAAEYLEQIGPALKAGSAPRTGKKGGQS